MATFRSKDVSLVTIFLVLFLALSPLVAAAPANELEARKGKCKCTKTYANKLIFKARMDTFQKYRKADNCCDFDNDGCSNAPDQPEGFNFLPSCQRHDFGYRNAKDQKRLTAKLRKKIDGQFKEDLYKECSQYSGWKSLAGVKCRRIADVYHKVVRECGSGKCPEKAKQLLKDLIPGI